ncbi:MAG: acetate/propionate family kinase [Chloroflexota bacterium]
MRILTINCGSSTLKFDIIDVDASGELNARAATGIVERIGAAATVSLSVGSQKLSHEASAKDYGEAFAAAVALLEQMDLVSGVEAVGHRVVHGGTYFRAPATISQAVVKAIEDASNLAPLHNRPALSAIREARSQFGDQIPMVATFDTAFYASLPAVASLYALPRELSEKHGIRRFGFHGLAHRYMTERFRKLRPEIGEPRIISLQLGHGCSATASIAGKPVDTSMGFTPLEGLIMGTRSGDVDPSIPLFIGEKEGLTFTEVESLLNTKSGLLGLSGVSGDMREVLQAAQAGNADADLAVRAFCYWARKYVGAYLAVLGGSEAIVFGGGIGENIAEVRDGICAGLGWAGLKLDPKRNGAVSERDALVSAKGSSMEAWVVHVDEAAMIAQDTVKCLSNRRP